MTVAVKFDNPTERRERERVDTEPTAQMTGDKSLTGWSSLWLHLFLLNGVMWWL